MRSPLSLLLSRPHGPSALSRSSYVFPSRPFTIFVALLWTLSNREPEPPGQPRPGKGGGEEKKRGRRRERDPIHAAWSGEVGPCDGKRVRGKRGRKARVFSPEGGTSERQAGAGLRVTTASPCLSLLRPVVARAKSDKNSCQGLTLNRSQRGSCSATYGTLTQNQVVYK